MFKLFVQVDRLLEKAINLVFLANHLQRLVVNTLQSGEKSNFNWLKLLEDYLLVAFHWFWFSRRSFYRTTFRWTPIKTLFISKLILVIQRGFSLESDFRIVAPVSLFHEFLNQILRFRQSSNFDHMIQNHDCMLSEKRFPIRVSKVASNWGQIVRCIKLEGTISAILVEIRHTLYLLVHL